MEQKHFVYGATRYQTYPAEDSTFPGNAFARIEDGLLHSTMACIDPCLDNISSSPHISSQWEPPSVQRFLNDPLKTAFFNPAPGLEDRHFIRSSAGIPPRAPTSHARFGSPISSQDPSSCSSALSPLADSLYDGFPSTPPYEPLMLPFAPASHLDAWTVDHRSGGFDGMRHVPVDTYVNPHDVNLSQEPPIEYLEHESNSLDLDLLHRSFSFEGYTTHGEPEEPGNNNGPVDNRVKRMGSPDDMESVKDEIHAKPLRYPAPPNEDDDDSEDGFVPTRSNKRRHHNGDDEDDDYKPGRRDNNTASSPTSRKAPKAKRPAAVKAEQNISRKRPRLSVPQGPGGGFPCPHCQQSHFKDAASLEIHVKKQHKRPYACVFNFAGCESKFGSKNEWKRHVASQHLMLHYWLCTEGDCGKPGAAGGTRGVPFKPGSRKDTGATEASSSEGKVFNRKDLFTQHLRRMHMPVTIKRQLKQQHKSASAAPSTPEWNKIVADLQKTACRERCQLPRYMRCPAPNCNYEFDGPNAWDKRMEHVAKHLEEPAVGEEPPLVFGGSSDPTLTEWAARPDIAIIDRVDGDGWVLNKALTPGGPAGQITVRHASDDDAEWEEEVDSLVGV